MINWQFIITKNILKYLLKPFWIVLCNNKHDTYIRINVFSFCKINHYLFLNKFMFVNKLLITQITKIHYYFHKFWRFYFIIYFIFISFTIFVFIQLKTHVFYTQLNLSRFFINNYKKFSCFCYLFILKKGT